MRSLLDVFKSHSTPDVLDRLKERNCVVQYVPGNCTSDLQPLDVALNGAVKSFMKGKFTDWYASKVAKALKDHTNNVKAAAAAVHPNLRLSVLKPIHAGRFMDCMADLSCQGNLIV